MSDNQRIIDKLKKLLALAADPGAAPNEAETARRQAESLMAKYRIEEAEVMLTAGSSKLSFNLTTIRVSTTPHYPNHTPKSAPDWAQFIIVGVGVFTEVRVAVTTSHLHGARFKLMGTVEDVAMAEWLFVTLVQQAYKASRTAVAGLGAAEAKAWRRGYAMAIQARLKALAQGAQKQAATSTALVVVDTAKKKALDEAFGAQDYGKSKAFDYSLQGYNAGQQARLNTSRPVGQASYGRIAG